MAVHDAYARVTPYELAFPSLEWARTTLAEIESEANRSGLRLEDPAEALALDATRRAIETLRAPGLAADETHSLALLLGHALRFWRAGESLALICARVLRQVATEPLPVIAPLRESSATAGYVQLPHRMVWMTSEGSEPPEPVDGFFWASTTDRTRLYALLVVGLRRDRAGFTVVPLPALALEGPALDSALLDRGSLLETRLPGAELEGLISLATTADAARVIVGALVAALGDGRPEAHAEAPQNADALDAARTSAPARSALPYVRISAI